MGQYDIAPGEKRFALFGKHGKWSGMITSPETSEDFERKYMPELMKPTFSRGLGLSRYDEIKKKEVMWHSGKGWRVSKHFGTNRKRR